MCLLSVQIEWMTYENIDNYNPSTKSKTLILFDDMIADTKKIQPIIKELFIRCRKLNTLLVFIPQSYFFVPKDVRLNSAHYLIMKINNRKESQNIAINQILIIMILREFTVRFTENAQKKCILF